MLLSSRCLKKARIIFACRLIVVGRRDLWVMVFELFLRGFLNPHWITGVLYGYALVNVFWQPREEMTWRFYFRFCFSALWRPLLLHGLYDFLVLNSPYFMTARFVGFPVRIVCLIGAL